MRTFLSLFRTWGGENWSGRGRFSGVSLEASVHDVGLATTNGSTRRRTNGS